MEQAAILKSGIAIKLTGLTNPKYTIYGFLNSFETVINGVTKKFRETVVSDFKTEDQVHKDAIGGFYEEQFFLEYLTDKNKLYQLKEHYYTFKPATVGDKINVRKLKVTSPYNDFCKIETYKWAYQPNIPIIDNGTWQITIPPGVVPSPSEGENVQLSNTAMQFYAHKIQLFVTPLTDTNDKQAKALLFAKIAIQINSIENIFNLIELNTNTDFGQYINSQKSEWSTQPIFANPTIEVLEDYMRNLTSFYKSFYSNQILIKKAIKKDQFYWLAKCLSAEALATVPTNDKIELLKNISDYSHRLTENNGGEQLALKVIKSFTFDSISAVERNDLLYALMQIQIYQISNAYNQTNSFDTKQTLFEILYSKIDDNRTGRYSYGIFNTDNNRQKFILMLYKIWKSSKYNPKYADPSYTEGANAFGIYPESYYMKLITDPESSIEKTQYYDSINSPAILSYISSSKESNDHYIRTTGEHYILNELKGKKITIFKQEKTEVVDQDGIHTIDHKPFIYGVYDLYQPISIIGFKPDLDLVETFKDPETGVNLNDPTPTIPVFFLYYMQDYSNLKKIDFGIMLATEIALNLIGVGQLSNLKYLNYLSKTRAVWTGLATSSETVLLWKAVTGVNGLIQFTAGNALAISMYIGNTNPDPDVKKFTEKLNIFLGILTIGSLLSHPTIKRRLYAAAADVLTQERKLISLGKLHGLDIDTMNAIRKLYGIDDLIDLMQLKLNNLPSHLNDNVLLKFTNFTKDEKYSFFTDFYNLKEETNWMSINLKRYKSINNQIQEYTLVDIWKNEILILNFARKDLSFLISFNRIKYVKNHEFKHVRYLKNEAGGHWFLYVTENINEVPFVKYSIVNENVTQTNIPLAFRTTVENVNGHLLYENLWKVNLNTTPNQLNGLNVTKKAKHYVINPLWNEQRLLEEMSYAWTNKIIYTQLPPTPKNILGTNYDVSTTTYRSIFSDGTKIEFIQRSHQLDPVTERLQIDHLSLMTIVKQYTP
ncbi:hypothetical protein IUY40_16925 [Flavobacterium sp. ALJ2]|uniref:hypothetical protein n=1 Tax=Flavobacterium sp. ALJ2 TaxID=2786960 RepID=UPI00189FA0FA|nr:hypothetical protein [Flavobacterium sp. ALJ2]MBF7093218.1 hypothetical protein [Flavobacterium sp. ALJ2]